MTNIERVRPSDNERPKYRILDVAGFFGPNDTLYEVGDEIYFDGEPALEMEPLNEPAREKITAILDRLDNEARKVAEKLGRPFVGMPRNLEGGLQLATALQRQEMAVMGAVEKANANTVEAAERSEVSAPSFGNPGAGKRKAGRPRKAA